MCRKRAGEEYKKKEDVRNKRELGNRIKQQSSDTAEPVVVERPVSKK